MTKDRVEAPGGPFYQRYWVCWIAFYLLIPTVLAVQLGAGESGSATFVAKRYYFFYFIAATLPNWWAMDIVTRLVQWVLRPWGPPLVVVLVVGAIVAMNLQAIWTPFRQSLFVPFLKEGSSFYSVFPWRYGEADYLTEAISAWIVGSAVWVAVNFFFLKVLYFPRFGYGRQEQALEQEGATSQPGDSLHEPIAAGSTARNVQHLLMDQLPENLGRNIIALKAEEHYTRVFTDSGEALVLIRFRDAVALLDDLDGVQTHRSYWVKRDSVDQLRKDGRSSTLRLTTGLEVPVSRSYRVLVHKALEAVS
ncbi:MAG: LytTR family DNA-binding domain-containing protein [Congregibacter sp.]